MRVVIGTTLLVGFIGGVVLLIAAEHVRSAWGWSTVTGWNSFAVNLPLNLAIVCLVAVLLLGFPWRTEMDALRTPWIGLSVLVLTAVASAGLWFTFALFVVNMFRARVVDPSAPVLWVTSIWFLGGVVLWTWVVWDHRRGRVERALERRAFTTPGVRSFAGTIVDAPGEPSQRDPLDGSTCVAWTADGTSEDIWEEAQEKWNEARNESTWEWVPTWTSRKERMRFDSAASAFYLLVDGIYVYVRPDGVRMHGRVGARVNTERLRHVDSELAAKVAQLDLLYVRTRVLRSGDTVVATGLITADASGRLSLQAKPHGPRNGALVPRASVRLLGRLPRDRRHRKALKTAA